MFEYIIMSCWVGREGDYYRKLSMFTGINKQLVSLHVYAEHSKGKGQVEKRNA